MRRNSLLILLSMIVLLVAIAALLVYTFMRSPVSDTTSTVVSETLPVVPEQQLALSSEPVGMPVRFVYIVSILVVFVSAVLVLFRMLLGISGKNEE